MEYDGLEEIVSLTSDFSADQNETNQRYEKNINELLREKAKLVYDLRKNIRSLRAALDEVEHIHWNGSLTRAGGSFSGFIGGAFAVSAGIAKLMTARAAAPLLFTGVAFGGVAVVTHLAGNLYEAYKWPKEIEKAEKDWKQALESLKMFIDKIEDIRNNERGSILKKIFQWLDPALRSALLAPSFYQGGEALELMNKGIEDAARKAAAESVDDVTKAGLEAFIKANAKVLSKVMIGVGAAFVNWDAVNMVISIKDVVFKRESEAAKVLREKADYLEHFVQFLE